MNDQQRHHPGFEITLNSKDDGTLEAAYVRFRLGDVDETKVIVKDTMIADFDAIGELLGIEILGPISLADLEKVVGSGMPILVKMLNDRLPEFCWAEAA